MKVAVIQWAEWFRDGEAFPIDEGMGIRKDQAVIVQHKLGTDVGRVKRIRDMEEGDVLEEKKILRIATEADKKKKQALSQEAQIAYKTCKELSDKHDMKMKLVRAYYSFDDRRLTFTFIADGRVDFRDLVKDLTKDFHKLIRLQQIGIRDEARLMGDVGPCGKTLCCATHLNKLESVTSELIDLQQLNHRGSERLSGMCGRLCCCLAYEKEGYSCMLKKLPAIGTKVKIKDGLGKVVRHHLLKETVVVSLEGKKKDGMIEVKPSDLKIIN